MKRSQIQEALYGEARNVVCGICNQGFKTQRYQHERMNHPLERNEKREKAAISKPSRAPTKGYKVWLKEQVDKFSLEKTLHKATHIQQCT
jgi:hypothetical protein